MGKFRTSSLVSRNRRMTVGLLGGSFNPAHDGHLHISREALKRLNLDQVWWMVSPQNPLKSESGMAGFEERFRSAKAMAQDPRIRVTDIERRLGTRQTAETLTKLTKMLPEIRFIWLMGADNLLQIHRWHRWTKIFTTVPLAVFARPTYDSRALAGQAAARFARAHLPDRFASTLAYRTPPAWVFLAIRRHAASATAIRASGGFPSSNPSEAPKLLSSD
ncbi:MAG: nicotinate-nucleotide adenylyltransferase [Alphaproteobacteria bacterium]|nr:nicotinate-nucleotide adenylyltransferase [Alphaproteobacteria bacterium]